MERTRCSFSRHFHALQGSGLWEKGNSTFEFARCSVFTATPVGRTDRGWPWDFTDFSGGRPLVQTKGLARILRTLPCPHTDLRRIRPPLQLCEKSTGRSESRIGIRLVGARKHQNFARWIQAFLSTDNYISTVCAPHTRNFKALKRCERKVKRRDKKNWPQV